MDPLSNVDRTAAGPSAPAGLGKGAEAPTDFRQRGTSGPWAGQPAWVPALYTKIATAMAEFKPKPKSTGLLSLFT